MRIAVIIATRGRAQRAASVIECARNLMSGQSDVQFVAALDADDAASVAFFAAYPDVVSCVRPRPPGVGDCWNRAAREHDADIYVPLTDDAWFSEPFWDLKLIRLLKEEPLCKALGVVGWMDIGQPTIVTLFGMTRAWIERNGGVLIDPRFPFWWGDTALVEIALFATGLGMPQSDQLKFVTRPGVYNPRLRDMDLWWDLFAATRHERVSTGIAMARAAGLPEPTNLDALIAQCEAKDAQGRLNAPGVLASIANPVPPSPEYEAAKAAAEAYLRRVSVQPSHALAA